MRKTLIIARREYLAAVRTKTFLIGLVLMPVLMGGSIIVQILLKDVRDVKEKVLAAIDLSPQAKVSTAIETALDGYNDKDTLDPATGKQVLPRYRLEVVAGPSNDMLESERAALERRLRKGDLIGFLEIGPDVLQPAPTGSAAGADDERHQVVYQTNRMSGIELRRLIEKVINEAVQSERGRAAGLSDARRREITQPVPLVVKVQAVFVVPVVLMLLMFLVLMMVANPLMQGVVEEKMQRIAEVLLGSVTPFELMLGKLLGMTAVSLTIVTVYLGGAIWAAWYYGFGHYLPSAGLLVWFFVFQTLAALMYGSLFTAIGAACTDMKETQNLLLPVMLLCCVPLFVLGPLMQEPNSPVVTGLSFFPFATPMLMIARMAVPPGVPVWQPVAGVVLVLLSTVACVWAAGRIFRVGLLLQGKAPRLGELVRWVFKG
jgi:ABC-2 type transport system permease protein